MKWLYDLFIFLYPIAARLLSFTNEKAARWIKGRQDVWQQLSAIRHDKKIVWVHCSSLGEFEQARPIIEQLPQYLGDVTIVLTFFSPSGYEVQKNYQGAQYVCYLPMDGKKNAARFYELVQPSLVIFIKYEFWYYYIAQAQQRKVPFILASGIFRSSQPFFQWYGGFQRSMLQAFTHFFVQDNRSLELLNSIGINNASLAGDTRFDRVLEIAERFEAIEPIAAFCGQHPVIVAGSTWTEDDEELDHYANTHPDIRFIIAPHNISKARIDECLQLYKHSITYSQWVKKITSTESLHSSTVNTLIIDNIGMLSRLYWYATITYVGGGFGGDGVHNVLEAAVYNKPVVFGPEYDKYIEAVQLIESGGGFTIESALQLEQQMDALLQQQPIYQAAAHAAGQFVQQHAGATKKLLRYIQEKRLFTT